jgi:hypothetical protein
MLLHERLSIPTFTKKALQRLSKKVGQVAFTNAFSSDSHTDVDIVVVEIHG